MSVAGWKAAKTLARHRHCTLSRLLHFFHFCKILFRNAHHQ